MKSPDSAMRWVHRSPSLVGGREFDYMKLTPHSHDQLTVTRCEKRASSGMSPNCRVVADHAGNRNIGPYLGAWYWARGAVPPAGYAGNPLPDATTATVHPNHSTTLGGSMRQPLPDRGIRHEDSHNAMRRGLHRTFPRTASQVKNHCRKSLAASLDIYWMHLDVAES